jgi:ComF family protein
MAVNAPVHEWPKRGARALLDFLYPPLCVLCRVPVSDPGSLCAGCWTEIAFLDGPVCNRCGVPFEIDPGADTLCAACQARTPAFDRARAVMRYDDASRKPVIAFKRADRLDLAPAFAQWLQRAGVADIAEADVVVPVPLHPMRLWSRRYNQAAILAKRIARDGGKPFEPLVLKRTRSTQSQGVMASAKARRRNVMGAFRVDPRGAATVKGRNVLLVDDVITTGATAEACARALKRAGAARVFVLALARAVRPNTI